MNEEQILVVKQLALAGRMARAEENRLHDMGIEVDANVWLNVLSDIVKVSTFLRHHKFSD